MLHNAIHNAIIRIRPLMITLKSLPPFVPRDLERDAVFGTEFFEFGHYAGCYDGGAGCEEGGCEGGEEGEFVASHCS